MIFRTDLALEEKESLSGSLDGVRQETEDFESCRVIRMKVDASAADRLRKPAGTYITLELPPISDHIDGDDQYIRRTADELRRLLPEEGLVLVAGIGNRSITPDALGPAAVEQVLATRYIQGELARVTGLDGLRPVAAVSTGVLGNTGFESAELIAGLILELDPAAVIAIDALAAFESERICTTVQITDTGIEPGSGVGNHRLGLTEETLGVKVIAVGVPMVVYASTIARDAMARLIDEYGLLAGGHEEAAEQLLRQVSEGFLGDMVVTPREIDELVLHVAALLSDGINQALQPDVDPDTLHTYIQG